MFTVPPLQQDEIDNWPIDASGLSRRIINVAKRDHIATIGELRGFSEANLKSRKGMGRKSIEEMRTFFNHCNSIESGILTFPNISQLLESFISEDALAILMHRFQLTKSNGERLPSLQHLGTRSGRSRERIRQIVEETTCQLRKRLPAHCMHPVRKYMDDLLAHNGGVADIRELEKDHDQRFLGQFSVAGTFRLFACLWPERYSLFEHIASSLRQEQLAGIHSAIREMLARQTHPLSSRELGAKLSLPSHLNLPRRFLDIILHASDTIGKTKTHLFFDPETAYPHLLYGLFEQSNSKLHYKELTTRLNELVDPLYQKGSGFVLNALHTSPLFKQTTPGIFTRQDSAV